MSDHKNKQDKDPIILDAEVIEETPAPKRKAAGKASQYTETSGSPHSASYAASRDTSHDESHDDSGHSSDTGSDPNKNSTTPPPPHASTSSKSSQTSKLSKLGWWTAFILAVFVGGLFSAPMIEKSLIKLGVMDESLLASGYYSQQDGIAFQGFLQDQIKLVTAKVADLEEKIERLSVPSGNTGSLPTPQLLQDQKATLEKLRTDLDLLAGKLAGLQSGQGGSDNQGSVSDPALSQALARLSNTVTQQQGEINRLAQLISDRAVKSASTSLDTGDLSAKITSLEGALTLERENNSLLKARLDSFEAMLNGLEKSTVKASPRGRLVLALSTAQASLMRGDDIRAALDSLRPDIELLPVKDQVDAFTLLRAVRQNGTKVERLSSLQSRYGAMASAVKKAEGEAESGLFSNYITLRKKGEEAQGVDKILYQAETALNAGRLEMAVDILKKDLSPPLQQVASDWLNAAEQKITAEKLLAQLASTITEKTAPVAKDMPSQAGEQE